MGLSLEILKDYFSSFIAFYKMVLTQFNAKLHILKCDNGGEYLSSGFSSYLTKSGIVHQTTFLGTSEQNGVVERKNHYLLKITKALMFSMHVPKTFRSEALLTGTYMMPSRALG